MDLDATLKVIKEKGNSTQRKPKENQRKSKKIGIQPISISVC